MFDALPDLDIKTFITALWLILGLAAVYTFYNALKALRESRTLNYYRLRRSRMITGWRLVLATIALAGLTLLVNRFGEPLAYRYYTVSPTPSLTPVPSTTPTITLTPTITETPTITPTLSETYTPTPTATPSVPLAVEVQFSSSVTPPPEAVFSPLRFAQGIDLAYNPINPSTTFTNPVSRMYAIFSYDMMIDGVQWTALWYRGGDLVHFETSPWEGGTGGFGYSDWQPPPEEWEPGQYVVHIFVGLELKVSGFFEVTGFPATRTPTPSSTPTPTNTRTPTVTITRFPTLTPTPTRTPFPPTATKIPTSTPLPTNTPIPTRTFRPSATP